MEKSKVLKALENIGWGRYHIKTYVICGMAWFSFDAWGTNMTYTLEGIKEEWGISNLYLGFIASSFQIGILLGNLAWGLISDKFGRKTPYRVSALLAFIGSVLQTFASDEFMMIGGYFILGFSMAGEVNLTTTIICEFCPPSKRFFLTSLSLFFSFGAIMSCFLALLIELANMSDIPNWRLIIGCLCFIQLGNCISRVWIDETPVFLFESNKIKEAEFTLNKISKINKKQTFSFDNHDLEIPKENLEINKECSDKNLNDLEIFKENLEINKECSDKNLNDLEIPNENLEKKKECSDKNRDIIKASCIILKTEVNDSQVTENPPKKTICQQIWRTILFLSISNILSIFSYVGMFTFILQFLFFLPKIKAYILMIILQFAGIPGALLGTKLVDSRLGRRWTTTLGLALCGIFTFLFGIYHNFYYVIIITSIIYFLLNLGSSGFFTLAPESFPTKIRSTAHGVVSIFGRVGGSFAPIVSGLLISENDGVFILLSIYGICFFVAGLIVLPLKETRIVKKIDERNG